MRIGVNLGPARSWEEIVTAAQQAEEYGFDSISLVDHYHPREQQWAWLGGFSLYGGLAVATSRIKLLPLVLCRLNHLPGVIAKETSTLAIMSRGRFEMGIGAGDYFEEMRAWGVPVPEADERIETLKETIEV